MKNNTHYILFCFLLIFFISCEKKEKNTVEETVESFHIPDYISDEAKAILSQRSIKARNEGSHLPKHDAPIEVWEAKQKEAKEAAEFYVSVFPNSKIIGTAIIENTPAGDCEQVEFELEGNRFMAISAGPLFPFNESISFMIYCDDQKEIDYYWEKLYPGLDNHSSQMTPIAYESTAGASMANLDINTEKMEGQLGGMLEHLEVMAGSMSSLKALQEADFSGASDQINKLGKFYTNLNEAMANINDSVEDTRIYKEQLSSLNENLATTNTQMKSMTTFYGSLTESTKNLSESIEDTRQYKQQLAALNKNLGALNSIYGNILSAMNPGRR